MFKLILVVCALTIGATTVLAAPQSRIVGGSEVDIAKHPYLVSLRYRSDANAAYVHKCAGFIYSESVVITAAQCILEMGANDKLMVVAGANSRVGLDGMPYPASKWFAHANFSTWTADYDIGIVIIDDIFDFTNLKIKSISIKEKRPLNNQLATVAGWGYREEYGPSSQNLEEIQVPIINSDECTKLYGAGEITERMICAGYVFSGGKDACQGDTGGPLVIDNQVVGLVSWGRGCARPNNPSVYTFVASLKQWIDETIAVNL